MSLSMLKFRLDILALILAAELLKKIASER